MLLPLPPLHLYTHYQSTVTVTHYSNYVLITVPSLLSDSGAATPPGSTVTETTTPDSISRNTMTSHQPVLLKRIPRQAGAVPSIPINPATTQLPIQKSNVVVERIRLMADETAQTTSADQAGTQSVTGSPSMAVVSNIVTLYKVNGDAFESCDIAGSQRIGQVKSQDPESHTGVITIAPGLLSIADNYFLGEWRVTVGPHRQHQLFLFSHYNSTKIIELKGVKYGTTC